MRTTVTLDDQLVEKASNVLGTSERSVILREALKALIERDAVRRESLLGGTGPDARAPQRRRSG